MKMRNGVVVFVVAAAVEGITDVSGGLSVCTKGKITYFLLCAMEEWRGEHGIGKNTGVGFRVLLASFATVPNLDRIFLCSSHTCSTDSDNVGLHRAL